MKRIVYFLIMGLLFSNCTHRVVRTGYKIDKPDYKSCDVVIKNSVIISDTSVTKIGEIKLGESGFSSACTEAHAINILKKEACSINADLIFITKESRPDIWSSCYKCKAEFYRFNSADIAKDFQSDERYSFKEVQKRVSKDKARNGVKLVGSFAFGFLFGFLLLM